MTVALWRIAMDAPQFEADELSGKGAEITGGRWNRQGTPVVYAATTVSLACLETVVHLGKQLPFNRFLVRIDVPDAIWASRTTIDVTDLKVGWSATPPGRVSQNVGAEWLAGASGVLCLVPSVLVPEEWNALINPAHPDIAHLTATKVRPWHYDPRL